MLKVLYGIKSSMASKNPLNPIFQEWDKVSIGKLSSFLSSSTDCRLCEKVINLALHKDTGYRHVQKCARHCVHSVCVHLVIYITSTAAREVNKISKANVHTNGAHIRYTFFFLWLVWKHTEDQSQVKSQKPQTHTSSTSRLNGYVTHFPYRVDNVLLCFVWGGLHPGTINLNTHYTTKILSKSNISRKRDHKFILYFSVVISANSVMTEGKITADWNTKTHCVSNSCALLIKSTWEIYRDLTHLSPCAMDYVFDVMED